MSRSPAVAVLLAWLVPGLGHYYIGQRGKGILFCASLVAMFVLGLVLAGGGCVNVERHPYALILQGFEGLAALAALVACAGRPELPASSVSDLGMLLTLVAGALNVLLAADVLYRAAPVRSGGSRG